jgi:hypothetical protein
LCRHLLEREIDRLSHRLVVEQPAVAIRERARERAQRVIAKVPLLARQELRDEGERKIARRNCRSAHPLPQRWIAHVGAIHDEPDAVGEERRHERLIARLGEWIPPVHTVHVGEREPHSEAVGRIARRLCIGRGRAEVPGSDRADWLLRQ